MYDKYLYLDNVDSLEEQINRNGQFLFKKQLIERYGCCVISKNTVDTIIDFSIHHREFNYTFIPSRRQIDYNSGYVNNLFYTITRND